MAEDPQQKRTDAEFANEMRAQTKASKKLGAGVEDVLSRAGKATDRIDSLIDGYDKIAKSMDLDKLGSQAKKLESLARKQKATFDLLEEFSYHAPDYVSKILTGGLGPKDVDGIIRMVEDLGKEQGKNRSAIMADKKAMVKKIQDLQKKVQEAIIEGDWAAVAAYKSQAEHLVDQVKDVTEGLVKAATQNVAAFQSVNDGILKKVQQMQADGNTNGLKYKFLMSTVAAGGKGAAATAIAKLLEKERSGSSHLGELSKATGAGDVARNFIGEDGKWSGAKATAYFAKGTVERAKMGWDAYKDTGRQFGMQHGLSDITSSYQATKSNVNMVALSTGRKEEEVLSTWKEVSMAIRSGNMDLKERVKIQLKATEETLDMENATGISSSKIIAITAAYRKTLGYGAEESSKAAKQVWGAMKDIESNVKEGEAMTGDELADIFAKVASDVDMAGMNMKKFSTYLSESYVYAKNLGIPIAKALEMAQKVADLQSGKSTNAARGNAALLMMAGQNRLRVNSGDQGFDQRLGMDQSWEDTQKLLQEKMKKEGKDDKEIAQLTQPIHSQFGSSMINAMAKGDSASLAAMMSQHGDEYSKVLSQMKTSGLDKYLGIEGVNPNGGYKGMRGAAGNRSIMASVLGMDVESQTTEEAADQENTDLKKQLTEAEKEKQLQEHKHDAAVAGNVTDPMAMFAKAVNIFTGSVAVFAAATVGSAILDHGGSIAKGIGKAGGWIKGLKTAKGAETALQAERAAAEAARVAKYGGETLEVLGAPAEAAASKLGFFKKMLSFGKAGKGVQETAEVARIAKLGGTVVEMGEGVQKVGMLAKLGSWGMKAKTLATASEAGLSSTGVGVVPALIETAVVEAVTGAVRGGYHAMTQKDFFTWGHTGDAYKERVKEYKSDWNNITGGDGPDRGFLGATWGGVKGVFGAVTDTLGLIGDSVEETIRMDGNLLKSPWQLLSGSDDNKGSEANAQANSLGPLENYKVDAEGNIWSSVCIPREAMNKSTDIDSRNRGKVGV